jgi:putative oxidoreductase
MSVVFVIGRLLFAWIFLRSGVAHLRDDGMMAGYSESKGVPAAATMVKVTGVMLLVGGILVALGLWADVGALLIAAFLLPTALIMHNYWTIEDPQARNGDAAHFYKDVSLLGAAIVVFYLYNQGQDLAGSLTNALIGKF